MRLQYVFFISYSKKIIQQIKNKHNNVKKHYLAFTRIPSSTLSKAAGANPTKLLSSLICKFTVFCYKARPL